MTTLVPSSCHCGLNTFKVPFATSKLPKATHMCHCNTCRHSTGAMSVVDPDMDGPPLSHSATESNLIPGDLTNLTAYEATSRLTRFFCCRCSTHMFIRTNFEDGPAWCVHWGTLEDIDGVLKITRHIFVGDTLDGGIADHIRTFAGSTVRRLKEEESISNDEVPLGWCRGSGVINPEALNFNCACGRINFYLVRPQQLFKKPEGNTLWLVPGNAPRDPIRFTAGHCVCNSCRRASGGQIQTWITAPIETIYDSATRAPIELINKEGRPKGLKQYSSSAGCYREYCDTCGAAVFWWSMKDMEGETPAVDVAAGLIDQQSYGGARAESWVAWHGKVMMKEFALSSHTVASLEEGIHDITYSD